MNSLLETLATSAETLREEGWPYTAGKILEAIDEIKRLKEEVARLSEQLGNWDATRDL